MNLEFSNQLQVDAETEAVVLRRVESALDRFEDRIDAVVIVGRDQNGPRGGIDKSCRITAHLCSGDALTVSEQGADFLAVVTDCADRLARSVAKAVERRNGKRQRTSFSG